MFVSKYFKTTEAGLGAMDDWLNGLRKPGYAVKVVGQCIDPNSESDGYVIVTTDVWKLGESLANPASRVPERTTIDEIPEEPSIDYEEYDKMDLVPERSPV